MAFRELVLRVTGDQSEGERHYKTLREAVEAARRMREPFAPCRIVVGGGAHFVGKPVCLDSRDNGLIIEGAAGESVTLCGGEKIKGWSPEGDRFWVAEVPGVKDGTRDFRTIHLRARSPITNTFCQEKSGFESLYCPS